MPLRYVIGNPSPNYPKFMLNYDFLGFTVERPYHYYYYYYYYCYYYYYYYHYYYYYYYYYSTTPATKDFNPQDFEASRVLLLETLATLSPKTATTGLSWTTNGSFRKLGGTLFWGLVIRILLFRVLY